MSISVSEWLTHLDREYLTEYIPQGGAAVKVAVVSAEDAEYVKSAVASAAHDRQLFIAQVDAAVTKAHLVQEVFFAIARQVDWRGDIDCYLRILLAAHGIHIEVGQALDDVDGIAEWNGRSRSDLLNEIKRLITHWVLRNYKLCREFRTAMALLCYAAVDSQSVAAAESELIIQWLQGEPVSLTELKRLQIFQRIGRHNARLLLRSLSAWQFFMGYKGTVLILDMQAILTDHSQFGSGLRYTRNSVLDSYEMLRAFIDDTDELSHMLLVAVVGPEFISHPKLSMDIYAALKMRLVNEVHDLSRDNPLNAMVSLVQSAG